MADVVARHGVVVIGRNEGERLRQCLLSLGPKSAPLVYVDSGSTDDSVRMAEGLGAMVVPLDMSVPFTAARARNEGLSRLVAHAPTCEWVQFVDGDCEVHADWLNVASAFLDSRPDVVAVTGCRSERFPDRSIFNALCDMDWQGAAGESRAFGGDVLARIQAVIAVGAYNPSLIAGEEPELSIRLRRAGWKIWHLDVPMTLHDANMLRFSQWWRRGMRTGYAYAEGAAMNGAAPERHWVRETVSAVWWGLALPVAVLIALPLSIPMAGLAICLYPLQMARIYLRDAWTGKRAAQRAFFLMVGKFAEATGVMKYVWGRLKGIQSRLIEYK